MRLFKKIKQSPFLIRMMNWEFWPFHFVYGPIYPVWLWYCLKARSFFFFGASNPSIKNGGFLMDSKKEIDEILPEKYKPVTLFFKANFPFEKVIDRIRNAQLQYPLLLKPDIGMQGKAVIKVNSNYELIAAASQFTVDYLIQSFVHYPREIGIFYVRLPNEENGRVTAIVEKEFLKVTGDGINSVRQLLLKNPRYILQLPVLNRSLGDELNEILETGSERILVPYGNHVRGSLFLDSTYKNNSQLETVIDNVCKSIKEFYFGRLDIRFNSFEELELNKNWCIIELNGAGSEPTHMYDPQHSLFFAWKEIIRHWKTLYEVSIHNKKKGFPFLPFHKGLSMFKANRLHVKKLNHIHFYDIGSGSSKDVHVTKSTSHHSTIQAVL